VAFLLLSLSLFSSATNPPRESIEVENILAASMAAPPELAADIRLQLVEKGLIKAKEHQAQALQEAFDLANNATFKLSLFSTGAGGSRSTDSDAGMLQYASEIRADTLSLKLRAVREFLRLDPKVSLRLFDSIPGPQIPSLSCSDAMGYSLSLFYSVLGELFAGAFGQDDRKKGNDFDFLMAHLARPGTSFELEPAAQLLCSLKLNKLQLAQGVARFAQALTEMPNDDRSFTTATQYSLMDAIYKLAQTAQGSGLPTYGVISALGNYLRDHLHSDRCVDTTSSGSYFAVTEKAIVEQFNTRFHNLGPDSKAIPLIAPEDSQPTSQNGKAQVYLYWRKSETQRIMADYKRLRFGDPDEQSADEQPTARENMAEYLGRKQRSRNEWLDKANDFLERLNEWDSSQEPDTAGFHEKCLIYQGLLDIVPKGNLRHKVFTEYLEFLRDSSVERQSPPEWAHHLHYFLKGRYEEGDQSSLTHQVAESGDSTMQCFAALLQITSQTK
jgi:hypothetical protein